MLKLFNTLFKGAKGSNNSSAVTPDNPCPFGYKNAWLVIKSDSPEKVIKALLLKKLRASSWESGIRETYGTQGKVFVSPCLDGYILVVGIGLDYDKEQLEKIGAAFDEVQYFATHRVVEYQSWAKFSNHKLVRWYTYVGESGEVLKNEGAMTEEEIQLGFSKFPTQESLMAEAEEDEIDFPDEESVMQISAAWGIDTTFQKKQYEKSTGFLCAI